MFGFNLFCFRCNFVNFYIIIVCKVYNSCWLFFIIEFCCLLVLYVLICVFLWSVCNNIVVEWCKKIFGVIFIFNVDCNGLKIGWKVEFVKIIRLKVKVELVNVLDYVNFIKLYYYGRLFVS